MTFLVRWEIDIEEDNITTPAQAAEYARQKYFKVGRQVDDACVFDVTPYPLGDYHGAVVVDLNISSCDCDDRSWHGELHDSACMLAGLKREGEHSFET